MNEMIRRSDLNHPLNDCCDEGPNNWEQSRLLFRSWEQWASESTVSVPFILKS